MATVWMIENQYIWFNITLFNTLLSSGTLHSGASINRIDSCPTFIFCLQWRIQRGGGQQVPPPPKIGSNMCFFFFQLCIRMLRNKVQIARESITTTLKLPGPLSGPWTPAESEFSSALIMCVRAHNLLRPP